MAVDFMGYRNFSAKLEENAVQEAASGLESVEKLIRLLSQTSQQKQEKYQSAEMEMDCTAVADVAVSKFKKVISLLGRTRTGHARFRRAPLAMASLPSVAQPHEASKVPLESSSARVYHATPIQQIPPPILHHGGAVVMEGTKDSSTTINFSSYSSAGTTSFMSSLTGDSDSKQPMSSSAFQITNMSQVSSAGKPPLSSSSFKRKCSSETLGSGKCGASSSGRCHCTKKRWVLNFPL